MRTLLVVIASVALLSACACPEKIVYKTVEVPVSVPCLKAAPQKPYFPLQQSSADEDTFILTKRALAEIEIRKGYEGELEAAVSSCISK